MIELFACKICENISKPLYNKLLLKIDNEKYERISRLTRFEDAQRILIADILLRFIISDKLEIANEEIVFITNSHGKPLLKNFPNFYFNISHSGQWIVCVIDNEKVGIDIEEMKPIDFDFVDCFFSCEEREALYMKSIKERSSFFYELWTLKESYVKANGRGLNIPLNSFTVVVNHNNAILKKSVYGLNYYFKQYNIDNSYKLSLCSKKNLFPDNIEIICIGNLINKFLDFVDK